MQLKLQELIIFAREFAWVDADEITDHDFKKDWLWILYWIIVDLINSQKSQIIHLNEKQKTI